MAGLWVVEMVKIMGVSADRHVGIADRSHSQGEMVAHQPRPRLSIERVIGSRSPLPQAESLTRALHSCLAISLRHSSAVERPEAHHQLKVRSPQSE